MPTPKKGPRLGGSPAHQRLLVSNLATQLFEHGRITTTEAKARVLRPVAEKLISKAKKAHLNDGVALHMRREVLKTIRDKTVVHELFAEIAPRFAERPGGYTRITKVGPRKGDNAPMAVIELVTEAYEAKAAPAAKKATAKKAAPAPAPAAAEEPTEDATAEPVGLVDADVATDADADAEADALPAGAHAPLADADEAPEGFPIKGNRDSMKFHQPDGQWFGSTVAEIWFDTAASAEAAGYVEAGSDSSDD